MKKVLLLLIVSSMSLVIACNQNKAAQSKEVAVDSAEIDTVKGKIFFALQLQEFDYTMILVPKLVDTLIPTSAGAETFYKGQKTVYGKSYFLRLIDTPVINGIRHPRDTFVRADSTRILPDFKVRQ